MKIPCPVLEGNKGKYLLIFVNRKNNDIKRKIRLYRREIMRATQRDRTVDLTITNRLLYHLS